MSGLLGTEEWSLRFWDGSSRASGPEPRFTIALCSARALDVMIGGMPERGFGRAFVTGDLEVEPVEPFLRTMVSVPPLRAVIAWPRVVAAAIALGARPRRGDPGDAAARLSGRLHSRRRDAAAVRHHYDLPVEFYALFLDPSLTYSCAYFEHPDDDLETAQRAKLDLVCRKLRLVPDERLLDIGCGYGSLLFHAAAEYGVRAVGVTLSPRQAELAGRRAVELGLGSRVEIRLADYRDPVAERYDAVASIGMVEHVGRRMLGNYARVIHDLLGPGGRALVHGITCPPGVPLNRASFINTFVFPDSELEDVSSVVRALETAELEVRDGENLREHYALTLSHWRSRLDKHWDEAVRIAGIRRARVWRLYLAGSEVGFRAGALAIHQTLAVRLDDGASRLPLTRTGWYDAGAGAASELVGRVEAPATIR